jgi:hypothetical protein
VRCLGLRFLGAGKGGHISQLLGGEVQGDALAQLVEARQELQGTCARTGLQRLFLGQIRAVTAVDEDRNVREP